MRLHQDRDGGETVNRAGWNVRGAMKVCGVRSLWRVERGSGCRNSLGHRFQPRVRPVDYAANLTVTDTPALAHRPTR